MVFDILLASVLIAFGVIAIFLAIDQDIGDPQLLLIMILGILAIGGGAWIIVSKITLAIILRKLVGLILIGFGLFMLIGFPDIVTEAYQRREMSIVGIFLGMIVLVFGLYLILS
ncbi:hypothetical protein HY494_01405 [Candidatus Woesearchaeota archaeon]|nr:hypothetical protein [Candidatus Woesearchaeota archaeon]